MGCLSITVRPLPQAQLAATPNEQAKLSLRGYFSEEPRLSAALGLVPQEPAKLVASPCPQAKIEVTPQPQAQLIVGEVCSVSVGEIFVLAASDGPLRTCDGGYLLLNPDYEQDDSLS